MVGITMTNAPMGVCYFEKNGIFVSNCKISSFGLLIPGRPILGIGLNVTRKAKKIQVFGVKVVNSGTINALSKGESGNRLVSGGLLEKEFEFKPSFNEYLKDMESVRSNRDKKQGNKLKKQKPNNNLVKTIPLEGVEENLKFGALEKSLDKKKVLKVVERDGFSKNAGGIMVKEARVRGKFNYKGKGIKEFKDGFDGKDRYLNTKVRKKPGEEMRGERLSKNHFRSIEPELEESKPNNNLVETIPLEGVEENLKLGVFERSLDKRKVLKVVEQDRFSKNADGIMVKEARVRGKFNYEGKGIKEFKDGFDGKDRYLSTKFRMKPGEETRGEILPKNQFSRIEPELEDSDLGKDTKAQNVQESTIILAPVQRKGRNMDITREPVHDASSLDMLEKKGTDGSQRDFRSIWKSETFNGQKNGFTGNKNMRRFERNYVQDEIVTADKFTHKSGKLTKSSEVFPERDDDNGLEVERAAFKNFDEFNDVMDKPRVSRMEMEERIQKLAKRLNGADIDMPEWVFSKTIRSAKIRFSDHSILRVIQILGKLGNWRRVLQVIEWLQMRERFKSHKLRFIYTTALDVLGKANRPVEALNIFHAMQQQMSSYPDLVTYHCVAVTLGQAGHLKELFDVIDIMQSPPKKKFKTGALGKWDPRLEPDIVVYNAVLNACVRRKQWEGAFWVLQQLEQQGQQPSTTTYGLVMEVMYTCGKYNLVHDFFRKVKKSSIPNALTYKVIVNTLWKEGKTDEAVLAVQDMERRGIVGSAALYYDLARCLCSAGRCQEALKQIEKICKVANKPLVVTYTGLIQACLDSGNIHNGAYIFSQMEDYCSPNLVTCNIMMKAYSENGMFEEAKELFHKMSEDGNHISSKSDYRVRVMPDIYTFNTMLDACIAEKSWDDFENIYRRMLHQGHHFNAKRHLRMIMDASRAGKEEALETTWNHLARANRIPPPPLIKERFCLKLEKDDYTAALSCITSHPMSDLQALSKTAWLNLLTENAQRFKKHTLFRLIDNISILINRSELPNPILQNLISACREFCRNHMTLAEIKQIESVCTFQAELPLKS